MQATGARSTIAVRISGPDTSVLAQLVSQARQKIGSVDGVTSATTDWADSGRFLDIHVDLDLAARAGLSAGDVGDALGAAMGGRSLLESTQGARRLQVVMALPRDQRSSLGSIGRMPLHVGNGNVIQLRDVATLKFASGPAVIRGDDGSPSAWIYVETDGAPGALVSRLLRTINQDLTLPDGYTLTWGGQYSQMDAAQIRLAWVTALTLAAIAGLLALTLGNARETLLLLITLPLSLVGGLWLTYLAGYRFSVPVAVGLIALAGIAAEFSVVMILFLQRARSRLLASRSALSHDDLHAVIHEGAVLRLRPKLMTAAVLAGGLLPLLWGDEAGADIMRRIAVPMIGGMITAPLLSLFVIPVGYLLVHKTTARDS
jgi:Cu(I)/Ag(I) efflux system membrane protein CusA/SilA